MKTSISFSQCTNFVLDWDYREFFARDNSTIRTYTSLAQSQAQYYAFGTNSLTINHNYTPDASVGGDNIDHTGSTGSYGTGADVEFTSNGTITLTFQSAVSNLKFSLYDIDRSQRVQFAATDGATSRNIILSKVSGTIISFTNNNSTNARADATNYSASNSSSDGTVNVDIAGPVRTVTITISNTSTCSSGCSGTGGSETGVFWLSDITACSSGSFPSNYHSVSRPFTGMPSYVVVVRNNEFYYMDPVTGKAKYLFTDNTNNNMNSVSYDPYNRFIYYTYSLSNAGSINPNEKRLRRYNYNTNTYGVVTDITTLGIPTFQQGVESAAASFYNGNLYLGVEGGQYTESIVWRIEFDGSNNPIGYSQVYAQDATEPSGGVMGAGTARLHDWADFVVSNGVLYDFDGGRVSDGTNTDFYQQNLLTGSAVKYTPLCVPRQTGLDWQGNIYNIGSSGAAGIPGTTGLYNGTNNQGATQNISFNSVDFSGGSWGDAAEAFRPFCDFGDAPATYDPDPWSPAVHERDTAIHIGATWDREWNKSSSALADADGSDEDGLPYVPIFSPGYGNYLVRVTLYNNTGEDATVIAWLDYNGNGVFDAGEACQTQPALASMPVNQYRWLYWPYAPTPLSNGSFTYLRIRLVKSSSGMTDSDPTGYYENGETEDYRVPVDNYPLAVNLLSFDAQKASSNKVKITWSAAEDINLSYYEVQRSSNARDWSHLTFVGAGNTNETRSYEIMDMNPLAGINYYRLVYKGNSNQTKYSEIKSVRFDDLSDLVSLSPNPAITQFNLNLYSYENNKKVEIRVSATDGRILYNGKKTTVRGNNTYNIEVPPFWPTGIYIVQVVSGEAVTNKKLVIKR